MQLSFPLMTMLVLLLPVAGTIARLRMLGEPCKYKLLVGYAILDIAIAIVYGFVITILPIWLLPNSAHSLAPLVVWPLQILLLAFYVLMNFATFAQVQFVLASHRLCALAFGDIGIHNDSIKDSTSQNLLARSFRWFLAFTLLEFYVVTLSSFVDNFEVIQIFLTLALFATAATILFGWHRPNKVSAWKSISATSLSVIAIMSVYYVFFFDDFFYGQEIRSKIGRMLTILAPVVVFTLGVYDIWVRWVDARHKKDTSYRVLRALDDVSRVATLSAYKPSNLMEAQAAIIALVFIVFFVLPNSGLIFDVFSFDQYWGFSKGTISAWIRDTGGTWVEQVPGSYSFVNLVVGGYGVVGAFAVWATIAILAWDASNSLKKVPELSDHTWKRFLCETHHVFLLIVFLPILTIVMLSVLFAFAALFGPAFAVFLGIFGFATGFHRVLGFLYALFYLLVEMFAFSPNQSYESRIDGT